MTLARGMSSRFEKGGGAVEVIVCHANADFDSLGCLTAGKILRPDALVCFPGRITKNVKELYSLYKDELSFADVDLIDVQKVTHLYVTDTQNRERIGKFKRIFDKPDIQLTIIDHHPLEVDLPAHADLYVEEVGAATTIMVEYILRQELPVSPVQATIMATAIYADTGCLTTQNTTPRDAAAVAELLARGANLQIVARHAKGPLTNGQRNLFEELLAASRTVRVNDANVCLTSCEVTEYVEGLAVLTTRLTELSDCDTSISVVSMDTRVHIVGRTSNPRVDLLRLLEPFGGKGHPQAASATVKGGDTESIIGQIEQALPAAVTPAIRVRDLMKSPVRTIHPDTTMEEAGRQLLRSGHSGMPVMEGDRLVGIVSRRDLDKANHHGLQNAPVKAFMSTSVITIGPDSSLDEAQRVMVTRDIGRLPVLDADHHLVGIVTRTDILRILHGQSYPHWYRETFRSTPDEDNLENANITYLIEERLGNKGVGLLLLIGQEAERLGGRAYLVGGMVRDMIIGYDNVDVDIVVEPEAIPLARAMAKLLAADIVEHPQFGTATLKLPNGDHIDFATARTEFYVAPAALPDVELATIRQDLYRRDFTINTLAVSLSPGSFGAMLDFFGARSDIRSGAIRVLYNLSFVEDPTRILRAVRFEQRYGYQIEEETERFLRNALENNLMEKVSRERLRDELEQILSEPSAARSVLRMDELGILRHLMSPDYLLSDKQMQMLRQLSLMDLTGLDQTSLYLMVILLWQPFEKWLALADQLRLPRRTRDIMAQVAEHAPRVREVLSDDSSSVADIWEAAAALHPESRLFGALLVDPDAWERLQSILARNDMDSTLTGRDLVQRGLIPGPHFGHILREIRRARLEGEISTPEEELELLDRIIARHEKGDN